MKSFNLWTFLNFILLLYPVTFKTRGCYQFRLNALELRLLRSNEDDLFCGFATSSNISCCWVFGNSVSIVKGRQPRVLRCSVSLSDCNDLSI